MSVESDQLAVLVTNLNGAVATLLSTNSTFSAKEASAVAAAATAAANSALTAADRAVIAADLTTITGYRTDVLEALAAASQIVSGDLIDSAKIPEKEINFNYDDVTKAIIAYPGAWRNQCKHLSWYDETKPSVLAGQYTSAKGQYASVAAAVAAGGVEGMYFYNTSSKFWAVIDSGETSSTRIYAAGQPDMPSKVIISCDQYGYINFHDATVEGCPLWKSFGYSTSDMGGGNDRNDIKFVNACLLIANESYDFIIIDFARDEAIQYSGAGINTRKYKGNISQANDGLSWQSIGSGYLPSRVINSVDVYTAKDAPIDPVTGELIPKIAIFTDRGAAVLHDDRSITKSSTTWGVNSGVFTAIGSLAYWRSGDLYCSIVPKENYEADAFTASHVYLGETHVNAHQTINPLPGISQKVGVAGNSLSFIGDDGITLIRENPSSPTDGLISKITDKYNTGFHKKSTNTAVLLCGTSTDSVSDTELISNTAFVDTADWIEARGASSLSAVSNKLRITADGSGTIGASTEITGLITGAFYSYDAVAEQSTAASSNLRLRVCTDSKLGTVIAEATNRGSGDLDETLGFIATADTMYAGVVSTGHRASEYIELSAVSLVAAEPDYSGNENHANVVGVLTKDTFTAEGDAVGIKGWSTSDYLTQRGDYSGDITVSALVEITVTGSTNVIFSAGEYTRGKARRLYINRSGQIGLNVHGTNVTTPALSKGTYHIVGIFNVSSRIGEIYVDGVLFASKSLSFSTPASTALAQIGISEGNNYPWPSDALIGDVLIESSVQLPSTINERHKTIMAKLNHGTTVPEGTVAIVHDYKNGLDVNASSGNVRTYSQGALVETTSSQVGTISGIAVDENGGVVQAGSTGLDINISERNLLENNSTDTERPTFKMYDEEFSLEGNIYWLPKGFEIVSVMLDGVDARENDGSTIYDYSYEYDTHRHGFDPVGAVTNVSALVRRVK